MRDSQPLYPCPAPCLPSLLRNSFTPLRLRQCLLRQCLLCMRSSPFISSQAIIRYKNAPFRQYQDKIDDSAKYFRAQSGISGHFRALKWDKWAISCSFLRKYRHFAWQSLNPHPPPRTFPDIFGSSRRFAKYCLRFSSHIAPWHPRRQEAKKAQIITLHDKVSRRWRTVLAGVVEAVRQALRRDGTQWKT